MSLGMGNSRGIVCLVFGFFDDWSNSVAKVRVHTSTKLVVWRGKSVTSSERQRVVIPFDGPIAVQEVNAKPS
jgi:hypothetical protein